MKLGEIRRSRSEGLLQVLDSLAPQVGLERSPKSDHKRESTMILPQILQKTRAAAIHLGADGFPRKSLKSREWAVWRYKKQYILGCSLLHDLNNPPKSDIYPQGFEPRYADPESAVLRFLSFPTFSLACL